MCDSRAGDSVSDGCIPDLAQMSSISIQHTQRKETTSTDRHATWCPHHPCAPLAWPSVRLRSTTAQTSPSMRRASGMSGNAPLWARDPGLPFHDRAHALGCTVRRHSPCGSRSESEVSHERLEVHTQHSTRVRPRLCSHTPDPRGMMLVGVATRPSTHPITAAVVWSERASPARGGRRSFRPRSECRAGRSPRSRDRASR